MCYLLTNLYPTKSSITLDKIKLFAIWTTTHPTIEACGKWLLRIAVDTSFLAPFVCQHYSVDHGHGSLNQICLHWTTFRFVYDSGHCQLHNFRLFDVEPDWMCLYLTPKMKSQVANPYCFWSNCSHTKSAFVICTSNPRLDCYFVQRNPKAQNEEAFCITDLINSSLLANHHTSLGTSLLHFGRF